MLATLLLTTQHLDEADQLTDRIAVVDHGRIIADGTSGELKAQVGGGALHVRVSRASDRNAAMRILAGVPGGASGSGWWDWKPAKEALEYCFWNRPLPLTNDC